MVAAGNQHGKPCRDKSSQVHANQMKFLEFRCFIHQRFMNKKSRPLLEHIGTIIVPINRQCLAGEFVSPFILMMFMQDRIVGRRKS